MTPPASVPAQRPHEVESFPAKTALSPAPHEYRTHGRQYSFASSTATTTTSQTSPSFGASLNQLHLHSPPTPAQTRSDAHHTPLMAPGSAASLSSIPTSLSPSPHMLPQPATDGTAMDTDRDHEATAALLMLTMDRRGLGTGSRTTHVEREEGEGVAKRRPTAMSVKELLSM